MENKPKDVAETCYIYSTKGFCERGLTCRFSRHHLDENLNNLKADSYNPNAESDTKNQISYGEWVGLIIQWTLLNSDFCFNFRSPSNASETQLQF